MAPTKRAGNGEKSTSPVLFPCGRLCKVDLPEIDLKGSTNSFLSRHVLQLRRYLDLACAANQLVHCGLQKLDSPWWMEASHTQRRGEGEGEEERGGVVFRSMT